MTKEEIIEEHVEKVDMALSDKYNEILKPLDGLVKWFRDELGQLWVKLKIAEGVSYDTGHRTQMSRTVCIPADRVRKVIYKEREHTQLI